MELCWVVDMNNVFENLRERGVGRVRIGHRSLGCVGYALECAAPSAVLVRLDPMPSSVEGDVLQLILKDGRILDCRVLDEHDSRCAVVDNAQLERRKSRRPPPSTRAFQ